MAVQMGGIALPFRWRDKASLDRSWAFVPRPLDAGQRTRFLFRSRSVTAPWWFTLGGWLGIIPADFVMSRDMLNGVKQRAEALASQRSGQVSRRDLGAVDKITRRTASSRKGCTFLTALGVTDFDG